MKDRDRRWLRIGPGMLVAASGIGASDVVATTVAGARYGTQLLWALAVGAVLKFCLTEGIARWKLATGTTLIQGWSRHLPRWAFLLFIAYLFFWCIAVSGALVSSCGMAVENLSNGRISSAWGAVSHAVFAFLLLFSTHSEAFSSLMKGLIAIMLFGVALAVIFSSPDVGALSAGLFVPHIPVGAEVSVLSLIGGVGGSVTLLGYNYLRLDETRASVSIAGVRRDLGLAYLFTASFAGAIMMLAERAFSTRPLELGGNEAVSRMADELGVHFGSPGFVLYSLGFWAAVVASLLGVWQLMPSIIGDCVSSISRLSAGPTSPGNRLALAFLFVASLPFAFYARPTFIVISFTVLGSLFIPFLAATLLFLNNRIPPGSSALKNSVSTNGILLFTLFLFIFIGGIEIAPLMWRR